MRRARPRRGLRRGQRGGAGQRRRGGAGHRVAADAAGAGREHEAAARRDRPGVDPSVVGGVGLAGRGLVLHVDGLAGDDRRHGGLEAPVGDPHGERPREGALADGGDGGLGCQEGQHGRRQQHRQHDHGQARPGTPPGALAGGRARRGPAGPPARLRPPGAAVLADPARSTPSSSTHAATVRRRRCTRREQRLLTRPSPRPCRGDGVGRRGVRTG